MIRQLAPLAALLATVTASCGDGASPAGAAAVARGAGGATGTDTGTGTGTASTTPTYREIGNWIVACDNVATCTAKAVMNFEESLDVAVEPLEIKIVRDAGPAGALTVSFEAQEAFDTRSVALDGASIAEALTPGSEIRGDDSTATVGGAAALALVRRMRDGQAVTATQSAKTLTTSLKGLAAVLLAIDEAQGRLGNATAFVRVGAAPASAVPAAPPLPVLTSVRAAPRAQLVSAAAVRRAQAAVLKKYECDPKLSQDEVEPLADGSTLVLLQCETYAYQDSSLVFRVIDPAKASLVILPPPPTDDDKDPSPGQYVSVGYDPADATLGWGAKGRGIADCGRSVSYAFDGREFRLASYHRQDACGGISGDWPTLYRSTIKVTGPAAPDR